MARPFAPEPQQWTSIWNGSGPDDSLFAELVTLHSPRLLRQLHQFTGSRVAHDLLQEVWLRAFQKRHTFAGDAARLGEAAEACVAGVTALLVLVSNGNAIEGAPAPLRAGFLSGAFAMAAGTGLARRLPAFGADRAGA